MTLATVKGLSPSLFTPQAGVLCLEPCRIEPTSCAIGFRLVAHRGVIRYQLEIHGAKVDKKNGMVKCRPGLAKAERLF